MKENEHSRNFKRTVKTSLLSRYLRSSHQAPRLPLSSHDRIGLAQFSYSWVCHSVILVLTSATYTCLLHITRL